MNARVFTLWEARQVLPEVKEYMATIQAARSAIMQLRPTAWPAISHAAHNGGSKAAGEMAVHIGRLETAVKAITGLGILIKDLDHGVIDFLGKRDGREVCLCWRHGEDDIAFWHDTDVGFAGRRPIDDQVL